MNQTNYLRRAVGIVADQRWKLAADVESQDIAVPFVNIAIGRLVDIMQRAIILYHENLEDHLRVVHLELVQLTSLEVSTTQKVQPCRPQQIPSPKGSDDMRERVTCHYD